MLDAKTSQAQSGLLQNDYSDSPLSRKLHDKRKNMIANLRERLGITGQLDNLGRPTEDPDKERQDGER
jgi:hypothetical protein